MTLERKTPFKKKKSVLQGLGLGIAGHLGQDGLGEVLQIGRSIQMRLTNLLDKNVKLLWEQAQYTDVNKQTSRLMHSGVRFQDRNNPIPEQIVPPRASVQEGVIPINRVFFSQQKKAYETKSLLPVDSEAGSQLKGKTINLFIPIEVDRAIIPYNFKIEITGAVKEAVKG